MKVWRGLAIAVLTPLAAAGAIAWLTLAARAAVLKREPGLVVICELGGVAPTEAHIASGFHCVLHDRTGGSSSAGAISVYDDTLAVP